MNEESASVRGAAMDAAERAPRAGRKRAEPFNTVIESTPAWTMQESDNIRFNVRRHFPEGCEQLMEILGVE